MAVTKGFVTRTSENGLADFVPQEKSECGSCSSMHSCGIGSRRKGLVLGVLLSVSISGKLSKSNKFTPQITKILKSNPNPSKNLMPEGTNPDTPACPECTS